MTRWRAILLSTLGGLVLACCGPLQATDPSQPPCDGRGVQYGQYCCKMGAFEWRCPLEFACGYLPGDCVDTDTPHE